jgi:hypothetical protein
MYLCAMCTEKNITNRDWHPRTCHPRLLLVNGGGEALGKCSDKIHHISLRMEEIYPRISRIWISGGYIQVHFVIQILGDTWQQSARQVGAT